MRTWEDLKAKFDLSDTHKKTYTIIEKVVGTFFLGMLICNIDIYKEIKWQDGSTFTDINTKKIYIMIIGDSSILKALNKNLSLNWSESN
jgi:hypothetical protein